MTFRNSLDACDTKLLYIFFQDMAKEIVNLESAEEINVHTLGSRVPDDHGRYHLFRFLHTHEGDFLESIGLNQYTKYFMTFFLNISFGFISLYLFYAGLCMLDSRAHALF